MLHHLAAVCDVILQVHVVRLTAMYDVILQVHVVASHCRVRCDIAGAHLTSDCNV